MLTLVEFSKCLEDPPLRSDVFGTLFNVLREVPTTFSEDYKELPFFSARKVLAKVASDDPICLCMLWASDRTAECISRECGFEELYACFASLGVIMWARQSLLRGRHRDDPDFVIALISVSTQILSSFEVTHLHVACYALLGRIFREMRGDFPRDFLFPIMAHFKQLATADSPILGKAVSAFRSLSTWVIRDSETAGIARQMLDRAPREHRRALLSVICDCAPFDELYGIFCTADPDDQIPVISKIAGMILEGARLPAEPLRQIFHAAFHADLSTAMSLARGQGCDLTGGDFNEVLVFIEDRLMVDIRVFSASEIDNWSAFTHVGGGNYVKSSKVRKMHLLFELLRSFALSMKSDILPFFDRIFAVCGHWLLHESLPVPLLGPIAWGVLAEVAPHVHDEVVFSTLVHGFCRIVDSMLADEELASVVEEMCTVISLFREDDYFTTEVLQEIVVRFLPCVDRVWEVIHPADLLDPRSDRAETVFGAVAKGWGRIFEVILNYFTEFGASFFADEVIPNAGLYKSEGREAVLYETLSRYYLHNDSQDITEYLEWLFQVGVRSKPSHAPFQWIGALIKQHELAPEFAVALCQSFVQFLSELSVDAETNDAALGTFAILLRRYGQLVDMDEAMGVIADALPVHEFQHLADISIIALLATEMRAGRQALRDDEVLVHIVQTIALAHAENLLGPQITQGFIAILRGLGDELLDIIDRARDYCKDSCVEFFQLLVPPRAN
jgi:hypothetical protein